MFGTHVYSTASHHSTKPRKNENFHASLHFPHFFVQLPAAINPPTRVTQLHKFSGAKNKNDSRFPKNVLLIN